MGDNVYLGERDGVRTPMQWSGDRNAGFSRANPQKLFLPVVIDPGFHFETINVESQQANPSSLLWWTKRLIALRRAHPVMATGLLEFLSPDNPKVLAFCRRSGDNIILVVANLSRYVQPVSLDLFKYAPCRPRELFGHTRFPAVEEEPYFLTLAPHGFYWFALEKEDSVEVSADEELPEIEINEDSARWFNGTGLRRWLERNLPGNLPKRRWFAGKSKSIRRVTIDDQVPITLDDEGIRCAAVLLLRVAYVEGQDEVYSFPLALLDRGRAYKELGESSPAILARVHQRGERFPLMLCDAAGEEAFWKRMREMIYRRGRAQSAEGEIIGTSIAAPRRERTIVGRGGSRNGGPAAIKANSSDSARSRKASRSPDQNGASAALRLAGAEQSNNSAIFGDESIMKLFRRVEQGVNPDLEISSVLTQPLKPTGPRRFENTPALLGSIEYWRRNAKGEPVTLAMLQQYVTNQGDAWRFTLDSIGRYFDRVLALPDLESDVVIPNRRPLDNCDCDASERELQLLEGFLPLAELLGQRTAELHAALASAPSAEFKPEPFTKLYQRSVYQSMRNAVAKPLQLLRSKVEHLEGSARDFGKAVLARRDELLNRLARISEGKLDAARIRCHGDYHLGQVLWTGRDFIIIDFEGEPMKPLSERRIKRSCLLDVAGILRSISYAAQTGLRRLAERGIALESAAVASSDAESSSAIKSDEPGAAPLRRPSPYHWASYWCFASQTAFCRGYFRHIPKELIPSSSEGVRVLLDSWLLVKAMYEISYELNNRPDWVDIPLRGVLELLDAT